MPNQPNYRSSINVLDKTFSPSRIVRFPQDTVLFEVLPAEFGYDAASNIEIHFYSQPANLLQLSLVVEPSDVDILKSHIVTYPDGTLQHYLRIDFTALFDRKVAILLPGEYKVVLNFFTDEIGAYNDRSLFVQQVSDSRTEVQLAFFETDDVAVIQNNQNLLAEFVTPSLDKVDAVGAAEKVFYSGVDTDNPAEGLIYENIQPLIEDSVTRIQRLTPTSEEIFAAEVNATLLKIFENLKERIIINGDQRIQKDELDVFIREAVLQVIQTTPFTDERIRVS